jgi:predicted nucleic acid-binding protein
VFVLDTNVISELRQGKPQPSIQVRNWAANQPSSKLYLSAITILELEIGIRALERRTPPQGSALRAWLAGVRLAFAGRVLAFTETTAPVCAALHVPDRRSDRDAMIAASALEHGFAVVTRNVADYADTGVKLVNPWLA